CGAAARRLRRLRAPQGFPPRLSVALMAAGGPAPDHSHGIWTVNIFASSAAASGGSSLDMAFSFGTTPFETRKLGDRFCPGGSGGVPGGALLSACAARPFYRMLMRFR